MIKKIRIKEIKGDIEIPASKSLFHRYLIMASRSEGVKITYKGMCDDVGVTVEALQKIGSKVQVSKLFITINGFEKTSDNVLDFKESGSSLRFILPYAFIEEGSYEFTGRGRLPERPLGDLLDQLSQKGVNFSDQKLPFIGQGQIKAGGPDGIYYKLRADISSQYISGLMMASSFIADHIEIDLLGKVKSLAYIDMTAGVMREFSYDVKILKDKMIIDKIKNLEYSNNPIKEIKIEGDWSNAMVAIALGLLKGNLRIRGLNKNSYQGDKNIVEILKNQGADLEWQDQELKVQKSKLYAFDMDIEENIDLFPVLSVLALSCEEKSVFHNINRLRLKESDRVEAVLNLHRRLGAKSYVDGDKFIVLPGDLKSCTIDSHKDHRLVMAGLVAAGLTDKNENEIQVTIEDFQAINKSYPDFEEDMKKIGVEILEIQDQIGGEDEI